MVKVFFDHQKFSTQYFGGISRYFATLIEHIRQADQFDYLTGVLFSKNQYLDEKQLLTRNKVTDFLLSRPLMKDPVYQLNQRYCIRLLKENKYDIFHPTYYDPYFLDYVKKPVVITIHDMTYERLPEYFWAQDPLSRQKRINIERADLIVAISETTKRDLLELSGVRNPGIVHVVPHGIDLTSSLHVVPVERLPESYLLFVGDRSGYKNFYLLLRAFRQIARLYPDLRLLLVGGGALGVAEHEAIGRYGLVDKITHRNVSDAELNYVYQKATLFVYPSLYEGFGLPILEAFRADCPVLLSDTDCFREVAADAARYFEPRSVDALAHQIQILLDDASLRQNLVEKGRLRVRNFPIQACVQKTLALYQSLM